MFLFLGFLTQKFVAKDTTFIPSTQKFVDYIPSQETGDFHSEDIDFGLKNIFSKARRVYSFEGIVAMSLDPGTKTTNKLPQAALTKKEYILEKCTPLVAMNDPQVIDNINIILDCLKSNKKSKKKEGEGDAPPQDQVVEQIIAVANDE
ncbi:hypothetical protein S245_067165 [Arachis hypogaea]